MKRKIEELEKEIREMKVEEEGKGKRKVGEGKWMEERVREIGKEVQKIIKGIRLEVEIEKVREL